MTEITHKPCNRCRKVKPLADFSPQVRGKYGRLGRCKTCCREVKRDRLAEMTPAEREQERAADRDRKKRRQERDPEAYARQQRDKDLRRWYGITLDQFEALFEEQGRRCASCRTDEHGGHNWHLDHCHATKKVRGILCLGCNVALGQLGDDVDRILALAEYVRSRR